MAFFNGDAKDPHNWVVFTRAAVDAGPDPLVDAQSAGAGHGATLLTMIKFGTATSVTFQVIYWNAHPKMNCRIAGPIKTLTPADPTWFFNVMGVPLGILITATDGTFTFAMSRVNRELGGS